ncbi:cell division protein ZapA [Spirochaetia bacterium]|nr:cell division protein ZapA [Spirochaetia bacterium]GHV91817.1 cell division protein ZapA [Spirochaetia bacterium]
MPKSDLRLDLLGTSFSISADEDAAYLEGLLGRFRDAVDNTQKSTGLKDPLKVAILTGFLLCDEIYKLKQQEKAGVDLAINSEETEQLTLDLIARLDEVLENKAPLP